MPLCSPCCIPSCGDSDEEFSGALLPLEANGPRLDRSRELEGCGVLGRGVGAREHCNAAGKGKSAVEKWREGEGGGEGEGAGMYKSTHQKPEANSEKSRFVRAGSSPECQRRCVRARQRLERVEPSLRHQKGIPRGKNACGAPHGPALGPRRRVRPRKVHHGLAIHGVCRRKAVGAAEGRLGGDQGYPRPAVELNDDTVFALILRARDAAAWETDLRAVILWDMKNEGCRMAAPVSRERRFATGRRLSHSDGRNSRYESTSPTECLLPSPVLVSPVFFSP